MVPGLSYSTARAIFPDQGSNPGPLHWQVDSYPLDHWGSPLEAAFGIPILWIRTTRLKKVQSIPLHHTDRNLGGRLHSHTPPAIYTNPLLPDLGGPVAVCADNPVEYCPPLASPTPPHPDKPPLMLIRRVIFLSTE